MAKATWRRISKNESQKIIHLGTPDEDGQTPQHLHLTAERESPHLWMHSVQLRGSLVYGSRLLRFAAAFGYLTEREARNAAEECGDDMVTEVK